MIELDDLIARGPAGSVAALDGLEDGVWTRVERAHAKSHERTVRVAALCVAAAIGGVAGGVTAPAIETGRSELSIFSPRLAATPLDVRSVLG